MGTDNKAAAATGRVQERDATALQGSAGASRGKVAGTHRQELLKGQNSKPAR